MSLHDAVKNLRVDEVRTLIATGSNLNEIDKLKRTPVHIAAWTGNVEILQLLIRSNAQLTDKAMDGFTPLHFAAQSASSDASVCVKILVKKCKSLLNQRITKGNKSALHLAAAKGNLSVIRQLIELGADVNDKTSSGQTVFDLAKSEDIKASIRGIIDDKAKETKTGKAIENENSDEEDDSDDMPASVVLESSIAASEIPLSPELIPSKKRPISEVTAADGEDKTDI
jgi:ankyrin repeat protein